MQILFVTEKRITYNCKYHPLLRDDSKFGSLTVIVVAALINDDAACQNRLDVFSVVDSDAIGIGPSEEFLGYLGHLSGLLSGELVLVIEELAVDGVVVGTRNVHGELVLEDGKLFLDGGEFLPVLKDFVLGKEFEQLLLDADDLLVVLVEDGQIVAPGEDLSFYLVKIARVFGILDLEVVSETPEFLLDLVRRHGVVGVVVVLLPPLLLLLLRSWILQYL